MTSIKLKNTLRELISGRTITPLDVHLVSYGEMWAGYMIFRVDSVTAQLVAVKDFYANKSVGGEVRQIAMEKFAWIDVSKVLDSDDSTAICLEVYESACAWYGREDEKLWDYIFWRLMPQLKKLGVL
jgi:hypothetical protein